MYMGICLEGLNMIYLLLNESRQVVAFIWDVFLLGSKWDGVNLSESWVDCKWLTIEIAINRILLSFQRVKTRVAICTKLFEFIASYSYWKKTLQTHRNRNTLFLQRNSVDTQLANYNKYLICSRMKIISYEPFVICNFPDLP